MKNIKNLISIILILLPLSLMGTPTIETPTIVNGTCKNNAKLTINVSNTGANVSYGLKGKDGQIAEIKWQLSNVFDYLPAGVYIISVYDNTTGSIPVTKEVTITTSYIDFKMTEPEVTQNICGGSIRLRVSGGSRPYLYRMKNVDTGVVKEISSNSTTYLFSDLEPGKYYAEIIDNCGEMRVMQAGDKTTIEEDALKNIPFTNVDYDASASYIYGLSGCNSIYFYVPSQSAYKINGSSNIPIEYVGKIRYRFEYPAGSNTVTDWTSSSDGYNYHYFYNYDRANPGKYRLQVEHPCTKEVISSPQYDMPQVVLDFTASFYYTYDSYCIAPTKGAIRLYLNTSGVSSYICSGYKIVVHPKNDENAKKELTWNNNSNTFYIPEMKMGTAYTIKIFSSDEQLIKTLDYTTPSSTSSLPYPSLRIESGAYNYGRGDFGTTRIEEYRTATSSLYSINTTDPITYTILKKDGQPLTTPIPTITSSSSTGSRYNTLWTDLPYGKYTIKIDYNGCRTEEKDFTFTQTVTGFDAAEPILTPGATCGAYDLKLKGYFLNMAGNPYTSSSSYYRYCVKITNLDTNTSYTRTAIYSNSEPTSLTALEPGSRHKIQYYAYYNNGSPDDIHYYKEQIVTVPAYQEPVLNIPLSGGITCGDEDGTLTLTPKGDRPPFLFRYKEYVENDDPTSSDGFCAWTSQNIFTGLDAGRYTVQISNSCGDVTRENVKIYSGSEQFVTLIGSFDENTICQGKSGLISVLSIGPVESYQWYKDDVAIVGATSESYTIPNMQLADEGTYKVVIDTGVGSGGCILSSDITVKMLPIVVVQNDSVTVIPFEKRIIDVYENDLIAACSPDACPQVLTADKIKVEGYAKGVLEGDFGRIEIIDNKVHYTAPEFFEDGVVRFTYDAACTYDGEEHTGVGNVAIFILQSCTEPTVCYAEGFEVCFKDYPASSTQFEVLDGSTPINLPHIYSNLQADKVLQVTPILGGEKFPTINFTIHVIPNGTPKVRWKGTTDHYWNNAKNWVTINADDTDGAPIGWVPNDCVDAEIPTASVRYPKLSTPASINNLFMKDRAMLAYSHKLDYKHVEVELNLSASERDRWVMYSAPLKQMYTGDFMLKKDATNILEDAVYMSFFQAQHPDDRSAAKAKTVTRTFGNSEQALPLGKSFFLKMHTNANNISKYSFPRSDAKYTYYNVDNWGGGLHPSSKETATLTRPVQGRFVADITNIAIDNSYTLTASDNMTSSEVMVINNPFPAYLNIKSFLEANSAHLKEGYMIWDGTENDLMKFNNGRGNTWTIKDIDLIESNIPTETEYIAPFQSFFVIKKVKNSNPSLIYKPEEMTTVEPVGISGDYILK